MEIIFVLIVLLFSIIIHEVSHGAAAFALGDPTAKHAGRLTLNPIKHIDPIGTILVPLILVVAYMIAGISAPLIGWAKPVPVNPYNFKDKRWGSLKSAFAGPAANIVLALVFGMIIRLVVNFDFATPQLISAFGYIVFINLLLALFNLIPIPPLDGSHILFSLLPASARNVKIFLSQYGFFILLILVFFFREFWDIMLGAINAVFTFIVGVPFL